jgi:8-oxo-dGTP pyrophosphatase MutT (NUDIX family)
VTGPAAHSVRLERRAARVLLLDPDGRLLLMRGHDPATPDIRHWFTVGGGVDPGESLVEAAVREIFEESGLVVRPKDVVGPVHEDHTEFGFAEFWVVQPQQYFVVRAPADWHPAPAALEPAEIDTVSAWSWWTLAQLTAHAAGIPHDGPGAPDELVYPADLPALLARVLR